MSFIVTEPWKLNIEWGPSTSIYGFGYSKNYNKLLIMLVQDINLKSVG